ncbi:hypothetical protein GCM10022216_34890 [Sphingobacterium kyonggiense]|uniref:Endonuclease/exonuclease/phosphatase domain-containing protein n=1 Tax=Sphingobacterium kyonggiense TaxID=714075 RepID=A0ABP7Z6J3_9SPHI
MVVVYILVVVIIVVLLIFKKLRRKLILVELFPKDVPEEHDSRGSLKLLTYNIAGLPQGISAAKLPRRISIAEIGEKVLGYDIVNVQEDFNYNTAFYSLNKHPYRTDHKGKIPIGDGLNTLSNYPIVSYRRIPWRHCSGPDCWTVKGFTYAQIQVDQHVIIDIYNVHANSSDVARAARARRENLRQLANYILENSADRPIIVMGDFNAHYAYKRDNLHEFLLTTGLSDGWVQFLQKGVFPEIKPKFVALHMLSLTNETESLDKIFFRGNKQLRFTPSAYEVEIEHFTNTTGQALSDHLAVSLTLDWEWTGAEVPSV